MEKVAQAVLFRQVEKNLAYLCKNLDDIPTSSGTYYWYHWPQFSDEITKGDLLKILRKYSSQNLILDEEISSLKTRIIVSEKVFNFRKDDLGNSILGLSEAKSVELLNFIYQDIGNFNYFQFFFKEFDVPQTEVWLKWSETPFYENIEISHIFEEIIQRKLKPGLVEKYGQ